MFFCGLLFHCFPCLINFFFFASFLTVEPPSILATGGGFSSFTLLDSANSTSAMEGETATPTKTTVSLIGSNWPSLPIPDDPQVSEDSPIQPDPNKAPQPGKASRENQMNTKRTGCADLQVFQRQRNTALFCFFGIPEIAEKIAPRVLSLVVSDLKTKRLVGLTKDVFEELLRKAGIPCQYFCRKSCGVLVIARHGMSSFLQKNKRQKRLNLVLSRQTS